MKIKRPKIDSYGGGELDKSITGRCFRCKQEHTLPAKEWAVLQKSKNKFRLICVSSLSKEERLPIKNKGDSKVE